MISTPQRQADSATPAPKTDGDGFSFHDFLSVVNPLQHLPVIGTIYRAITGDTIGTMEKIAGDALYGGLWGAVASVADAAFEAITGKDVGETVLALFDSETESKPVQMAANVPAPAIPPANPDANLAALTASLTQKGVDSDIAQRALFAYRKSMTLPDTVLAAAR